MFLFLSPLAFFGLPLFVFLFLCLSLFFFSFFLPSCLSFLLSFGSLFLSLSFFLFHSSLIFFHQRNNIKIFNCKFFFINIFFGGGFSVLVFLSSSFFLSLFFCWFKVMFIQHHCFWFQKKPSWKTPIFGQKGGCNKTVFFLWPCVFQNVKSYRFFGGHFFGKFWLMFKKAL